MGSAKNVAQGEGGSSDYLSLRTNTCSRQFVYSYSYQILKFYSEIMMYVRVLRLFQYFVLFVSEKEIQSFWGKFKIFFKISNLVALLSFTIQFWYIDLLMKYLESLFFIFSKFDPRTEKQGIFYFGVLNTKGFKISPIFLSY